uniref:Secreted protein n=1 Tax=Cacopsylla melanoneura TaxID=428564 RepID=A0A8D9B8K5_9HEMI
MFLSIAKWVLLVALSSSSNSLRMDGSILSLSFCIARSISSLSRSDWASCSWNGSDSLYGTYLSAFDQKASSNLFSLEFHISESYLLNIVRAIVDVSTSFATLFLNLTVVVVESHLLDNVIAAFLVFHTFLPLRVQYVTVSSVLLNVSVSSCVLLNGVSVSSCVLLNGVLLFLNASSSSSLVILHTGDTSAE